MYIWSKMLLPVTYFSTYAIYSLLYEQHDHYKLMLS